MLSGGGKNALLCKMSAGDADSAIRSLEPTVLLMLGCLLVVLQLYNDINQEI